jgi:hypothetical protein
MSLHMLFNSLLVGVLSGVAVATLGLLLFDTETLRRRVARLFGVRLERSFARVRSRSQVVKIFNELFVSNTVGVGGRILLMSNTGGYPEFDPFPRLVELSAHKRLEIVAAVTSQTIHSYYADHPEVLRALVERANVHVYTYNDLTPYKFRIGINTDIGKGFFCAYYGHDDNRVYLEGLASYNPVMIEALEAMFWGLIARGVEVSGQYLDQLN